MKHNRKNYPQERGWVHYRHAVYSEERVFPDGTGASGHLGNDFTNGHRGASKAMRGLKSYLRHAERRTKRNHIQQSIEGNV